MKLNLGCGFKHVPGYTTVDSNPAVPADYHFDIGKDTWPFADNSADEVLASHVLEHLGPGPEPLFHCMQEMYRVCKPGAVVLVVVPHPRHDFFLHDPTHMRPITPGTLAMFSRKAVDQWKVDGVYGITPFAYYLGVDFKLTKLDYRFDARFGRDTPVEELIRRERSENNVVTEYIIGLQVVKNVA